MKLGATRVTTAAVSTVSRITGCGDAVRHKARLVGMPWACIDSLTRYSRNTGPRAARPSPRRENGGERIGSETVDDELLQQRRVDGGGPGDGGLDDGEPHERTEQDGERSARQPESAESGEGETGVAAGHALDDRHEQHEAGTAEHAAEDEQHDLGDHPGTIELPGGANQRDEVADDP